MLNLESKIVLATTNRGKIREIRDLVKDLPIELLSLSDVGPVPDVDEDRDTFEENAKKKARVLADYTGMVTLADDSGLCIDALDGRPGVLSARYSGQGASDAEKCEAILKELEGVPQELRGARFVCVLALAVPHGEEYVFTGVCHGTIIHEPRGDNGFGYDPIFLFEEFGYTFAQMDRELKNEVSHRGRALREFAKFLRDMVDSMPPTD